MADTSRTDKFCILVFIVVRLKYFVYNSIGVPSSHISNSSVEWHSRYCIRVRKLCHYFSLVRAAYTPEAQNTIRPHLDAIKNFMRLAKGSQVGVLTRMSKNLVRLWHPCKECYIISIGSLGFLGDCLVQSETLAVAVLRNSTSEATGSMLKPR